MTNNKSRTRKDRETIKNHVYGSSYCEISRDQIDVAYIVHHELDDKSATLNLSRNGNRWGRGYETSAIVGSHLCANRRYRFLGA